MCGVTECQMFYGEIPRYKEGGERGYDGVGINKHEGDNILPLYGVIGKYMAAFLPAIPLNHLDHTIKWSHSGTVIVMAVLYRDSTHIIIIAMDKCTIAT
ncbi:Hypothetical predicted protein, partial [Xyrichtys novacula]